MRNPRAKVGHNQPPGKLIGYARVSTKEQELRVQLDDLEAAGCWNIYKEHASASKRRKRPQLELALMDLRPGDTLVVWRLDRFARNMRELYQLLDRIHEAGAGFKSLRETIDMSTAVGRMLLGIFGVLAQFEAELTAERTAAVTAQSRSSQRSGRSVWLRKRRLALRRPRSRSSTASRRPASRTTSTAPSDGARLDEERGRGHRNTHPNYSGCAAADLAGVVDRVWLRLMGCWQDRQLSHSVNDRRHADGRR